MLGSSPVEPVTMDYVSPNVGVGRRIVVVEDDALTRGLLAEVLESSGFEVATASTSDDAFRVVRLVDPDALVLDVDLGLGPTGFDIADALLRTAPHLAVLFLTQLPDARFASRDPESLPPGSGYLRKEKLVEPGILVNALDALLRGVASDVPRDDQDPDRPLGGLSKTQISVLRMVSLGYTNEQIAEARGTSNQAVRKVIARALNSIGEIETTEGTARVVAARNYMLAAGIPLGE